MNWKWKVPAFWVTSYVPGGKGLRYAMQRHLTKSLPVSDEAFAKEVAIAESHAQAIEKHSSMQCRIAEIGTGWDMILPLYLSIRRGFKNQVTVDISRLLRGELVQDSARRLGGNGGGFGIRYLVVRSFGEQLSDGEFDCVMSTNTFEHIPVDELPGVLSECRRVLKPEGILSLRIDYADHYSYFDQRISPYNFLRYSEKAWRVFNPPDHYQNRLRHSDYIRLLENGGFRIVEHEVKPISPDGRRQLRALPVDRRFYTYAEDDLGVLWSFIVAKPLAERLKPAQA